MPSSRFACFCVRNARLAAGLISAVALAACGGGGGGGGAGSGAFFVPPAQQPAAPAPGGTSGESTVLMRIKPEAVGVNCTLGGARVEAGLDADNNHVLADSEVTSTQYICNATAGADGLSTLVRMRAEPAGSNCAQGGSQVLAGKDLNRNDVLEDAEVTSSAYVCGGAPGATGAAGAVGSNGRDSLLAFAAEAPGGTCAYGGQRVQSGLDLNANGVLDAAEVTATAYVCAAAPADTRWVSVTASSFQTESNTGYQANSSTGVTLTLPPAPTVGDWIKVVGVGSGGWTIAQNAGQRIDTRGLPGGTDFDWRPVSPAGSWSGIASSADATRLAAVSTSGELYTSDDSGATWIPRLMGQPWSGIASSSDGLSLIAASNGGALYRSADGGLNWTNDGSSRAWSAVASSADGSHLVATAYLGQIWTSADGGGSWTARESSRAWRAVASSADGRVLVAATNGSQLFVSTDYGVSWTPRASGQFWWSVAASADGSTLYATVDTGAIWLSIDSGTTWEAQTVSRDWRGIATSADGRYVVAATSGGRLYESSDSGRTWRATSDGGSWTAVASSTDGLKVAAAKAGSAIQLGTRRTSTTLGTAGSISGGQQDSLELQYVGGGVFTPVGYVLANAAFVVR
ncbi:WD40/YVTN/BNR-like repeat-containing protein [Variovorax sp. 160MFSha2.1]|uniref:WD40/YVTN/BNR-like repeat-containing protein n=1 Tax=Variovorax sp. 160MFSha2.1 TaxID=3158367 RepID=UPI003AAA40D8